MDRTRANTALLSDAVANAALGLVHRVAAAPARGGPAVVMLHGQGGDEDAMWVFAATVPRDWTIVAPRGPVREPGGGYSWRHVEEGRWPTLEEFDPAVAAVVHLIDALPATYGLNPNRVYLMGFSQGAAVAYATAFAALRLVAGIAGLVGFLPTPPEGILATRPLAGLPVFMAEGMRDLLVPSEVSADCLVGLRAGGAVVEHHAYPTAHKISRTGKADLAVWMRTLGR